ncbi:unnamed protein product [Penicillium bialowiezense]
MFAVSASGFAMCQGGAQEEDQNSQRDKLNLTVQNAECECTLSERRLGITKCTLDRPVAPGDALLADIENSVDMSTFLWTPEDVSSVSSDANPLRPRNGTPAYDLVAGDFVCPDNFRLPADYCLELDSFAKVPVHRLEVLARLFFTHFYTFFPILHIPTFCLASSSSLLVRVICFIGTGFDGDPASSSDARLLYGSLPSDFAKFCLHPERLSSNFEELQAFVLFQLVSMTNGKSAERAASRLLHPLLISAVRQEGLLKVHGECTKAVRNAHSWQAWIQKELRKRVLWGVYAVDCYQSLLCGSKPHLSPTDTRASFPCDESSWYACSSSIWAALPAQDPSSCFLSSVKALMVGAGLSESNTTRFGMNLLILAVHSLLLEAQTSILPVDLSAVEKALETWQRSWEQLEERPHHHQQRLDSGYFLITNSRSLCYLATHFLKSGRPVLDERAYMEKSKVHGNPLIVREEVYQDTMSQCVREMLAVFQDYEFTVPLTL